MKNKARKRAGTFFIIWGLVFIACAAALALYNLCEDSQASKSASAALIKLNLAYEERNAPVHTEYPVKEELVIPDHVLNPKMDMPIQEIDGQKYIGTLNIPALNLTLPIISEWSYPALKVAPCRYSGSAYTDTMVIAGHNYSAHFAALKSLNAGDKLSFTDIDGNVFEYAVSVVETLQPTEIEKMIDSEWDLSLFTCTVSGKARTTVRCERIINLEF